MGRLIRVYLGEKRYAITSLENAYANLGGRGLGSGIIAREVPPAGPALAEANKLVIAAGILAGTSMPESSRLFISAKSPQSRTIKTAGVDDGTASVMVRLGLQAIVLEGRADTPITVKIDKKGAHFLPAGQMSMAANPACLAAYRKQYGDGVSILAIGKAGPRQNAAMGIGLSSKAHSPQIVAEDGLGAVMGSKNVKALIIDDAGGNPPPIKDMALFSASAEAFAKEAAIQASANKDALSGLPLLMDIINRVAAGGTYCRLPHVDAAADETVFRNGIDIEKTDAAMESGSTLKGDAEAALSLIRRIAGGKLETGGKGLVLEKVQVSGKSSFGYHAFGNEPAALFLHRYFAAMESLGLGYPASLPALAAPELQRLLIDCVSSVLDASLGPDYLMRLGAAVLAEEYRFNRAAAQSGGVYRFLPEI